MGKKKITFIVNPVSGNQEGKKLIQLLEKHNLHPEFELTIMQTQFAEHAVQLTKEALDKHTDYIVACGGDGTINEVAQQLIGKSTPLGIIPIGSGNGLATNLNLSKNLEIAIQDVFKLKTTTIDVGQFDDYYFFSNIGFGLDAEVINEYSTAEEHTLTGYVKAFFNAYKKYHSRQLKLTIDHHLHIEKEMFFLLCSNSNVAGYGITFTPQATLSDGKLDLVAVEKLTLLEMFQFGFHVINQSLDQFNRAQFFQLEHFTIKSLDGPLIVQMDGEAFAFEKSNGEVKILKQALNVLIP